MNKVALVGIPIVIVVASIVGVLAVLYQDNFENSIGLPQPGSEIGFGDEVTVNFEKSPAQQKTDESELTSGIKLADKVEVTIENQTGEKKSYEFQINETLGLRNP